MAGVAKAGEVDAEKVLKQGIGLAEARQPTGRHLPRQWIGRVIGDRPVQLAEPVNLQGLERRLAPALVEAEAETGLTNPQMAGQGHHLNRLGIVTGEVGIGPRHNIQSALGVEGQIGAMRLLQKQTSTEVEVDTEQEGFSGSLCGKASVCLPGRSICLASF
jgi:hypothetical protein